MTSRSLQPYVAGALLTLCACTLNLQHDLSEDDANDIYVLLQKKSIDATKIKEGEGKDARYIIAVPKADVAAAAELLREHSLPRPKASGLAVFKETKGMIPTQTEERAMFIEALGGEISNALNRVPGVLEARTIVMIPETNDLAQPDKKPTPSASVLIKYMAVDNATDGGAPGSPLSEENVRTFVANAVPELTKERVTVLMREAKFVTEESACPRIVRVLGVNVEERSSTTLKTMIAIFALLFLAMAGTTAFMVIRKPAPPRRKTNGGGMPPVE